MNRWVKTYLFALAAIFVIDGVINLFSHGTWFNPEGRNLHSLVAAPVGITGLLWVMDRYESGWRKWVYGIGLFVLAEITVSILFEIIARVTGVNLSRI